MDFAVCGMRPHKDVKPVIKMLTPNVLMKERKIYVHSAKKMFCFQVKNVQVNHDEQQLQCTIFSSSILVQAFGFSGLRCGFSGMKSSDGVVWQLYFELNCKRKNFQEY